MGGSVEGGGGEGGRGVGLITDNCLLGGSLTVGGGWDNRGWKQHNIYITRHSPADCCDECAITGSLCYRNYLCLVFVQTLWKYSHVESGPVAALEHFVCAKAES